MPPNHSEFCDLAPEKGTIKVVDPIVLDTTSTVRSRIESTTDTGYSIDCGDPCCDAID